MTDLRDLLGDTHHLADQIAADLKAALNVLAGHTTTGLPTTSTDGPHVSGGGTANPVAGIVTAADNRHRRAAAPHPDRATLDHAIAEATRQLRTALGIVHRHTPAGQANPDAGEPGCVSCRRVGQHTTRFRGDLCNWCYKHRHLHPPGGPDMPAQTLVAAYHRNGRINSRDLENAGVPL